MVGQEQGRIRADRGPYEPFERIQLRFQGRLRPLALLLRCGLALVFLFHGYPKLFGKTAMFASAFKGLGLPAYFVYIAGVVEMVGGLMLALGLYIRLAALLLVLDMIAAVWKYNLSEGIDVGSTNCRRCWDWPCWRSPRRARAHFHWTT